MIPIEPEPGNAGAGNRNFERVSASPKLFFFEIDSNLII
jgi:hypothetical protein